jgi:hypothetical protein
MRLDCNFEYFKNWQLDTVRYILYAVLRIRITLIRILSFALMRSRIWILASKERLKTLKKSSNRLIHISYILACHLQIDADPDLDPAYHFNAILILFFQFDAYPDPDP